MMCERGKPTMQTLRRKLSRAPILGKLQPASLADGKSTSAARINPNLRGRALRWPVADLAIGEETPKIVDTNVLVHL